MAPSPEKSVEIATNAAITAGRGHRLMLHAAGLAEPLSQRSVALIAPSGTGKTTAAATLGRQLGYLTDETVIVDPDTLAVVPFPKPLSIVGASEHEPKTIHSPDALGLLAAPDHPRLHSLVLLERTATHTGPPQLDLLSLGEALGALLPQTSSVAALDRGLVQLCGVLDQLGGLHRLRYAEADALAGTLDDLLQTEHPESPPPSLWHPVPADELTGAGSEPHQYPALRRAAVDDAVFLADGGLAVLHRDQFSLLRGLGPAIWERTRQPITLKRLIDVLSADSAAPPKAGAMVKQAVEQLQRRGLLLYG